MKIFQTCLVNDFLKWSIFPLIFKCYRQELFTSALVQCFPVLFRNCFQILIYLIHQFWDLKRQGLHYFWLQALRLKFQVQIIALINLIFFVRSSVCCTINFACFAVFLSSLTERYEVSDDALERGKLGRFGFL